MTALKSSKDAAATPASYSPRMPDSLHCADHRDNTGSQQLSRSLCLVHSGPNAPSPPPRPAAAPPTRRAQADRPASGRLVALRHLPARHPQPGAAEGQLPVGGTGSGCASTLCFCGWWSPRRVRSCWPSSCSGTLIGACSASGNLGALSSQNCSLPIQPVAATILPALRVVPEMPEIDGVG